MIPISKIKYGWFLAFWTLGSIFLSACQAEISRNSLYRGNEHRTGFFETEGIPTLTGLKWQFETADQVWSSPVVAGGAVYFGSDDDHLYAVSVETEKKFSVTKPVTISAHLRQSRMDLCTSVVMTGLFIQSMQKPGRKCGSSTR